MFQPKGKNSESMKTVEVELSEDFLTGKLFSDIVTKDLVNVRVNQKCLTILLHRKLVVLVCKIIVQKCGAKC
jgi:hypothetical protein